MRIIFAIDTERGGPAFPRARRFIRRAKGPAKVIALIALIMSLPLLLAYAGHQHRQAEIARQRAIAQAEIGRQSWEARRANSADFFQRLYGKPKP